MIGGNIMRTVNTSEGLYCVVAKPDFPALYEMTEKCRGLRRRYSFEKEAGIPSGYIHKIKHNIKTGYYRVEDIEKIVKAKAPNCNVTEEDMIAANGMVPMDFLKRILFILQPEKKEVQDLRKKKYTKPQLTSCDYYPDDRNRFNDDFAAFCCELTQRQRTIFRKHQEEIFDDKALVRMLYKYRKHKEEETQAFVDNFLKTDNPEALDEKLHLIENYHDMILDIIKEEICKCTSTKTSKLKSKEMVATSIENVPVYTYFGKGLASFSK